MLQFQCALPTVDDTIFHAKQFAEFCVEPAVCYLEGDLGLGKTTFVRAFLSKKGVSTSVISPTFTLLECYDLITPPVYHIDLYRLESRQEIETLGLRDLEEGAIWIIEWPQLGHGLLPCPDVTFRMTIMQEAHHLQGMLHTLQSPSLVEYFEYMRQKSG